MYLNYITSIGVVFDIVSTSKVELELELHRAAFRSAKIPQVLVFEAHFKHLVFNTS
jgi:hypothetical protein